MERLPTYSDALNEMMGGGFAKGGIVEIFGDEGAGKTGLVLSLTQLNPLFFFDLDATFPVALADAVADQQKLWVVAPPMKTANDFMKALDQIEGITVAFDPVGTLDKNELKELIPLMHYKAVHNDISVIMVNHCNVLGRPNCDDTMGIYATQRLEVRLVNEIKKKINNKTRTVGMKIAMRCIKDATGASSMQDLEEEIIWD